MRNNSPVGSPRAPQYGAESSADWDRLVVAEDLDILLRSADRAIRETGLARQGDSRVAINLGPTLMQTRGSGTLQSRWLTAEVHKWPTGRPVPGKQLSAERSPMRSSCPRCRGPAGVEISDADSQPLPSRAIESARQSGAAPASSTGGPGGEHSPGGILVPDHAQFPAFEPLGQIRSLFLKSDDVQVTVCVEIRQLDQVIDEPFRPADRVW